MQGEVPGAAALNTGMPRRVVELEAEVRGLMATACPAREPAPPMQWLAWLSGRKLYLATESPSFVAADCELPEAASCILPRLLPRDGGAEAFVLSGTVRE